MLNVVPTPQATSSALEAAGFTPLEVQRFIAPAASTALIDALRRRGLTPAAAASLLRHDGSGLSLELEPRVCVFINLTPQEHVCRWRVVKPLTEKSDSGM